MKKSELKTILKPLIKECIKEVIFEEGVLSGIISEVVQGTGAPPLVERQEAPSSPLAGVDPHDSGVDISSLVGGMNYKGMF